MKHSHWPSRWLTLVALSSFLLLQSCYSYIVVTQEGVPEPDPNNGLTGFYKDKQVVQLDTVVNMGLTNGTAIVQLTCPQGGLHSVESKVTLGGALKSGLTFGRKRNVRIKYVCIKEGS